MKPYFSIIIPTYNRSDFLSKAIKSVLNQSFHYWELIIIDDGSTDNTKALVASFKDRRITYIYQNNSERSAARNNGIKRSQGEWICFLDSDDLIENDYLESLLTLSEDKSIDCILIGHKKHWIDCKKVIEFEAPNYQNNIVSEYCDMAKPIATWEVVSRKKVFNSFLFNEDLNVWEDTHLYYRILSRFNYKRLNTISYIQIMHENSWSFSAEHKIDFKMINNYYYAIKDLFDNHSSEISLKKNASATKTNYLHQKNQMFFHRAYIQNDSTSSLSILKIALKNKSFFRAPFYYSKSFIKYLLLRLFKNESFNHSGNLS